MPLPKTKVSFQDYFKHELENGKTEFRLVAEKHSTANAVSIYIHPLSKDGESRKFVITGEEVNDVTQFLPE